MPQAVAVLVPALMIVANAVIVLLTTADRLAGSTAATTGILLEAGNEGGKSGPAAKRLWRMLSTWVGSAVAIAVAISCCVPGSVMPRELSSDTISADKPLA